MPTYRLDPANVTRALVLLAVVPFAANCNRTVPHQSVGPMAVVLPPQPDLCGLVRLDMLIGQEFVSLADQPLVGTLRVVWPGQEITSDIIATRLNAEVSEQGLILGLSCG